MGRHLRPMFTPQALFFLEQIRDRGMVPPFDQIQATVDGIVTNADAMVQRSRKVRSPKGRQQWQTPVLTTDWCVIWWRTEHMAVVTYIGPTPKR